MCLDGKRNDQMAFHALADYQNHVIGWLQWEQSSLGDGAVVRFPRIWMSSGECRFSLTMPTANPVMIGIHMRDSDACSHASSMNPFLQTRTFPNGTGLRPWAKGGVS